MKDPESSYNKLWQAKMQELPTEGDANTAWQKMHGLLNENMPVKTPVSGVKKPWHFPGAAFVVSGIAIIAAISIVYFIHSAKPANSNKPGKTNNQQVAQPDSMLQANGKNDSALNTPKYIKQIESGKGAAALVPGDNIADSASNKGGLNNTKVGVEPVAVNKVTRVGRQTAAPSGQYSNFSKRRNKKNMVNKTGGNSSLSTKTIIGQAGVSGSMGSVRDAKSGQTPPGSKPLLIDKTNLLSSTGKETDSAVVNNKNAAIGSTVGHKDSTANQNTSRQKPLADTSKANKIKNNKPVTIAKAKPNSKNSGGNSGFELELKTGFNTNKNSTVIPMAGIFGAWYVASKLSVGIGANVLSYRLVDGTYSNGNYYYTATLDSGKTARRKADNLIISSSAKIYTVDVPILATYRITNWLSVKGGPVISIPLKKPTVSSTLSSMTNPVDTLSAYHTILSAANNTTIKSNINMGVTGILSLNFERFNINGGYLQSVQPYTFSSSLGKANVYYHSFHLGISYLILQPKKKKKK